MNKFCARCGHATSMQAQFCNACGSPLAATPEKQPNPLGALFRKIGLWVGGLFVALVVILGLLGKHQEGQRRKRAAQERKAEMEKRRQEAEKAKSGYDQLMSAATERLRAGELEPACGLFKLAASIQGEIDKTASALAVERCAQMADPDLFPKMLSKLSDAEYRRYLADGFPTLPVTGDPAFDAVATQRLVAAGKQIFEFRAAGQKIAAEAARQAELRAKAEREKAEAAMYISPFASIYSGLVVYNRVSHEKVFTILGGNDSMPLPNGETIRAIVVKFPNGTIECKDRTWFIQSGQFVVRSDDPALDRYEWREYSRCPGFGY